MIEIVDDGEGMSEYTLSCAISIAFTKKDFTTGKHYGMGVTTAVPRLAKNALCFSYDPKGPTLYGRLLVDGVEPNHWIGRAQAAAVHLVPSDARRHHAAKG